MDMLDNSDKLGFWDKHRRIRNHRKARQITLIQAFWMYWE